MTTPIVPSISDEQLADLERLAESVKGWNMPEAFQEAEEGVHPDEWEWHVGAIDEDGNQYPLLHVNAHQYDSGDSELLASYYAACNREAVLGLIARLRAAEADDWIPIESAPLDGSEILLMRGERVTSGAWIEWTTTCPEYHSSTGAYLGQSEQDSGASWASWDGGFTEEEPPTHWRRLPKPKAMERTP